MFSVVRWYSQDGMICKLVFVFVYDYFRLCFGEPNERIWSMSWSGCYCMLPASFYHGTNLSNAERSKQPLCLKISIRGLNLYVVLNLGWWYRVDDHLWISVDWNMKTLCKRKAKANFTQVNCDFYTDSGELFDHALSCPQILIHLFMLQVLIDPRRNNLYHSIALGCILS